jgi:ATP-binding cassette, subfamily D (ALD), peroxisomal long-chain fatty acid import protein
MITVDIQRFSNHLAAIYGNLAKPVLDMILYNYQLSQNVGAEGLVLLTILVNSSAALLRAVTPPFGTYTAHDAALAGTLRHTHSRLAEASEEIAFYGGEETEKMLIERDYFGLIKHATRVLRIRLAHGIVEEWIIKWLWGSLGVGSHFYGPNQPIRLTLCTSWEFVLYLYSSRYPALTPWILVHERKAS